VRRRDCAAAAVALTLEAGRVYPDSIGLREARAPKRVVRRRGRFSDGLSGQEKFGKTLRTASLAAEPHAAEAVGVKTKIELQEGSVHDGIT